MFFNDMEFIIIELSVKRFNFDAVEPLFNNLVFELLFVFDQKLSSSVIPANYMVSARVLDELKQLQEKWRYRFS